MKHVALLLCVLASLHVAAQTVRVTSTQHVVSSGATPVSAMAVQISGTGADEALDDFESFWKDRGAKADVKDDEMKAVNFAPKDLKPNVYTLFGRADKVSKDESTIILAISDGAKFIDATDPAYTYFEQQMKAFGVAQNRKPIEKELKEATRALEKSMDNKKSLEKDRVDWQKNIDDCNDAISKNQSKLKESEATIKDLSETIGQQTDETAKLKQRIEAIQ